MGKSFSEIFQSYVNMNYDELMAKAKAKLSVFQEEAEKYFEASDVNVSLFIITFVSQAIAADGKFSSLEQKFISDLLGIEAQSLVSLLKSDAIRDEEHIRQNRKTLSLFSKEGKSAACILALTVAAIDESITREESDFLRKMAE